MQGDRIVSRFSSDPARQHSGALDSSTTTLAFDKQFGIPSGSMAKFLEEIQKVIGMEIERIQIQGRTIAIDELKWEPKPGDEHIMEQDDVLYYADKRANETHYRGVDSHENLLFTMVYKDGTGSFTPGVVSNPSVAGFYAIYLIDKLELDVGEYHKYNSFNAEILEETGWFLSQNYRYDMWYFIDDSYPILLTIIETDLEDQEHHVRDQEEATMSDYWSETHLDDSGMEQSWYAQEHDQIYNRGSIEWEDEHDSGDPDETLARTDYYAQGNGDPDTVTHPVSDGTMRVSR